MPEHIDRVALRKQLARVIADGGTELPHDFDDHSSMIRSGLLDSTALFQLVLWSEDYLGSELDLTTFDLAEEWDSVAKLLAFTERSRRQPV